MMDADDFKRFSNTGVDDASNRDDEALYEAKSPNALKLEDSVAPMKSTSSILVSACLLGDPCRYDGASVPCDAVAEFARIGGCELVPVCPEQLGGLPTPRTPSEIQPDGRVVDKNGVDRTEAFEQGARKVVEIAREHGCMRAILKSRSPSCGVHGVYDGTFCSTVVPGTGVAAAALLAAGIEVVDEKEIASGAVFANIGKSVAS